MSVDLEEHRRLWKAYVASWHGTATGVYAHCDDSDAWEAIAERDYPALLDELAAARAEVGALQNDLAASRANEAVLMADLAAARAEQDRLQSVVIPDLMDERDAARAELEDARDHAQTIVDEQFSLELIMPIDDLLSILERGLTEGRMRRAADQAELERLRRLRDAAITYMECPDAQTRAALRELLDREEELLSDAAGGGS